MYNQKPLAGDLIDYGHPLSNGLVGCWLFNEGSGNKVFDLSGNGQDGTLGTSMSWIAGKYGNGLNFPKTEDGTDYITIAAKASLRTDYISLIAWVKPGGASAGNYGALWWDQQDASHNRILVGDDGSLAAQLNTAGGIYSEIPVGVVPMNVWSQVAFTWDGVTGRHYVNGLLQYSKAEAGGVITKSSSDILIGIGQAGQFELDGIIDHIIVYKDAKTASEIASLYREPFCMVRTRRRRIITEAPVAAVTKIGASYVCQGSWGVRVFAA